LSSSTWVPVAYAGMRGPTRAAHWTSRGLFFAAASEAWRLFHIKTPRRKRRQKRGGALRRVDLDPAQLSYVSPAEDLLDLNDALEFLAAEDPQAAQFVKLRYFAGLSVEEAAGMVGLGRSAAWAPWAFARARLHRRLRAAEGGARG